MLTVTFHCCGCYGDTHILVLADARTVIYSWKHLKYIFDSQNRMPFVWNSISVMFTLVIALLVCFLTWLNFLELHYQTVLRYWQLPAQGRWCSLSHWVSETCRYPSKVRETCTSCKTKRRWEVFLVISAELFMLWTEKAELATCYSAGCCFWKQSSDFHLMQANSTHGTLLGLFAGRSGYSQAFPLLRKQCC